jgi:hypothetical protein
MRFAPGCHTGAMIKKHAGKFLFCILIPFLTMDQLFADSYRCGRKLIRTGDSAADVLRICGEPRYKDRGNERIKVDGSWQSARVERWYYQKSSRSLERVVLIHQGEVRGIDTGSR